MQGRILASIIALTLPAGLSAYASDLYDVGSSPYHTYIARKAGDIVTIVVEDQVETLDEAKRKLTRKNGSEISFDQIFFPPVNIQKGLTRMAGGGDAPGFEFAADNTFDANAQNTAKQSFETTIQVRLIEEVTEGQFIIRGTKNVNINGKPREVFVSGVIRQRDITPSNTISSDKIADALIEIEGETGKDDVETSLLMNVLNTIF